MHSDSVRRSWGQTQGFLPCIPAWKCTPFMRKSPPLTPPHHIYSCWNMVTEFVLLTHSQFSPQNIGRQDDEVHLILVQTWSSSISAPHPHAQGTSSCSGLLGVWPDDVPSRQGAAGDAGHAPATATPHTLDTSSMPGSVSPDNSHNTHLVLLAFNEIRNQSIKPAICNFLGNPTNFT